MNCHYTPPSSIIAKTIACILLEPSASTLISSISVLESLAKKHSLGSIIISPTEPPELGSPPLRLRNNLSEDDVLPSLVPVCFIKKKTTSSVPLEVAVLPCSVVP